METIIKQMFAILKDDDYIVTGSYALMKQGVLDRKIKDLDIIPIVWEPIKHKIGPRIFINKSDESVDYNHGRFLLDNGLHIDFFMRTNVKYITVTETDSQGNEFQLKIERMEDIYLQKIKSLRKCITKESIISEKVLGDLNQYFEILKRGESSE